MPKLVIMHPREIDNGFYRGLISPDRLQLEYYDQSQLYDPDTVFLFDWFVSPHKNKMESELQQGRRIVVDFKTEHFVFQHNLPYLQMLSQYPEQHLFIMSASSPGLIEKINVLPVANYFWWEMLREYRSQSLENYVPDPKHSKKFFLQVRRTRPWRDLFFEKMTPVLDQALWSYVEKKQYLPGDMPNDIEHGPSLFQRYGNPDWYNSTDFSLTVETSALPLEQEPYFIKLVQQHGVFLSEKSYKPLAWFHPFMIMGQPHTLDCVKQAGFETFPELWDESYDQETDFYRRINFIMQNIQQFESGMLDNPRVQEKLRHNHDRFYNQYIVDQKMREQIIDPLINFVSSPQ